MYVFIFLPVPTPPPAEIELIPGAGKAASFQVYHLPGQIEGITAEKIDVFSVPHPVGSASQAKGIGFVDHLFYSFSLEQW